MDCTMGFITINQPTIWENIFGSLVLKHQTGKFQDLEKHHLQVGHEL